MKKKIIKLFLFILAGFFLFTNISLQSFASDLPFKVYKKKKNKKKRYSKRRKKYSKKKRYSKRRKKYSKKKRYSKRRKKYSKKKRYSKRRKKYSKKKRYSKRRKRFKKSKYSKGRRRYYRKKNKHISKTAKKSIYKGPNTCHKFVNFFAKLLFFEKQVENCRSDVFIGLRSMETKREPDNSNKPLYSSSQNLIFGFDIAIQSETPLVDKKLSFTFLPVYDGNILYGIGFQGMGYKGWHFAKNFTLYGGVGLDIYQFFSGISPSAEGFLEYDLQNYWKFSIGYHYTLLPITIDAGTKTGFKDPVVNASGLQIVFNYNY